MSKQIITSKKRSLAKTITWRFLASSTTFLLAWLFTRELDVSLAIGGAEVLVKTLLYYGHERVWATYSLPRVLKVK